MQRITHDELIAGRNPKRDSASTKKEKRATLRRARALEWLQILNQIDEDCGYRML